MDPAFFLILYAHTRGLRLTLVNRVKDTDADGVPDDWESRAKELIR